MSMNSHASLFYGIAISIDDAKKIVNRFRSEIDLETEDDEDDYGDNDDIYQLLESIGEEKGFEVSYLGGEIIEPEDTKFGIAVWEETTYDWEGVSELKLPNKEKLDAKWAKLAKTLKLGNKKPRWFQFTQWS